jgi:hypothetical protein
MNNMFDLEQSIVDWRQQMLAAGIKTPVPLEELENHLREEIERQMESGLDEQNAFTVALRKIGSADPLQQEFKKISSGDKLQRQKRVEGIISIVIFGCCALFMSGALLLKQGLTFDERLSGFAAVATLLASQFVIWRILPRFVPVIASKAVRSAIGIVGGAAGAVCALVFAYFVMPRCNFSEGQLIVAILWAFVPVYVLPATAIKVIDKSEGQPTVATSS